MGEHARRRSSLKLASRNAKPTTLRAAGPTKTMTRLRARAAEIETLQQFEEVIRQAHPDSRGPMRKLMTPMLRLGLPCCGPAMLARVCERQGKKVETWEHTRLCPSRNLVELVEL